MVKKKNKNWLNGETWRAERILIKINQLCFLCNVTAICLHTTKNILGKQLKLLIFMLLFNTL